MTKPQITITIDGPRGAGKTTLAHYIGQRLRDTHGVHVHLHDDGQQQRFEPDLAELPNYFDADVTIDVVQK